MIEILNVPERVCKCWKCHSELSYTYPDIETRIVSDYTGHKEIYRYITCPVCKTDVMLKC